MTNADQVIPVDVIIERVWGYHGEGNRELVRGLVRRLRRKIEPDPSQTTFIHNHPGVGIASPFSPPPACTLKKVFKILYQQISQILQI
ncbi:MAG: helix-turn-helix domain-containing protein [Chloroflexota bacterium]